MCANCKEAFAVDKENRAAAVHSVSGFGCACERKEIREGSPGRVADDEFLCFLVSESQYLLPEGKLSPDAVIQIDRGGLSTLRSIADTGQFEQTLSELRERSKEAGKERYLQAVCVFKVSSVRYEANQRFLCVYDTPLVGKPHHADIMAPLVTAESSSQAKKLQRARYKKLIELIEERLVEPSQFRDGALRGYSRTG